MTSQQFVGDAILPPGRALLSIWPWDENAMAQAVALAAWWCERPTMPFLVWIEPLRRLS